ncbi:hypothetical protein [Sinimarinibacterium flocculans]|uniref:hypothetical protein n=1 Tax=Sinimarinibacterium flocculans TaxID=985250 RepID=UPI003516887C
MRSALCAVLVVLGTAAASAGEPPVLEPALQMNWQFGSRATSAAPQWRLGLYPGDLAWRRMSADLGMRELAERSPRAELLGLQIGGTSRWHLGGLALDTTEPSEPNWPLRIGIGVAVAVGVWVVAIDEVGEALAEGLGPQPGETDDEDEAQGGILCIDGQCVLPCGTTGPVNGCNGG